MNLKKLFIYIVLGTLTLTESVQASDNSYITFHTSKKYLQHINRGYNAMDSLNYPLALKEFMTAKYLNNDLFAAYDGLGKIYETTKNYANAFAVYQKALDLIEPKYADELIKQIRILRVNQQVKAALGVYKIVLDIRPEAGLQVLYGDKKKKEGKWREALTNYKRAYELQENPDNYLKYLPEKYSNKEYERYIIRKYIQKGLRYPEAHFKSGLIFLERGYYDNAIEQFKTATEQISVYPVESKYIKYLGLAYYSSGISNKKYDYDNLNNAVKYFEKYLKYAPEDADGMIKLANAYFYKDIAKMETFNNEESQAEKEFISVSHLSSQDPEYRDKMSTYFSVLDKKYNTSFFDDSLDALETAITLENCPPEIHYALGNVYFKKGMIYHIGFYDRQKYMNSEKVSARNYSWDYYQKALNEYRTYTQKKPRNNGLIFYDLGVVYYNSSKLEPDSNKLPVTTENAKEYMRYGTKFFKRDMYNRSVANFRRYLNTNPRAGNVPEVRNLINEMSLAMINLW